MDRITKITWNAFTNYVNLLRRGRSISLSDKAKLVVLYFFYYLKHRGYYLLDHIDTLDEEGNSYGTGTFVFNRQREKELNKIFNKLLGCLSKDSCFIKPLDGDDCTQLVIFSPVPPPFVSALVTNNFPWDDPEKFDEELWNDPDFWDEDHDGIDETGFILGHVDDVAPNDNALIFENKNNI